MSNAKPKISSQLKELLQNNEKITQVHFDANGDYHLNVYEETKPSTNREGKVLVDAWGKALTKKTGKTVAGGGHKYIVETLNRDEVLSAGEISVAVSEAPNAEGKQPGS